MDKFYWEVTAMTPHCGEELVEYCITATEERPYRFGDALMEDCVAEWFDSDEYEMYGYESAEEYEESYYEGCYCEYRRITKEDYEKYTASYYRPM